MKEWKTPRLTLRRLRFEDLYDYYERICSDGEVMKYLPQEPHQDIGESMAELEQTLALYETGDCLRWAVTLEDGEELIGLAELTDVEQTACALTCRIAENWWNQGYGTEVFRELIRYAVEELGMKKVTAEHFAPNAAAGAALTKAGMEKTGVIPGKYEKQGQLQNAVCYAYTAEETQPLTANEYQKLAMTTLNPDLSKDVVLLNGVMGLCGEAGECIDLVKKHLHQGHALDREKLAKELGDVAWYLAETAYALDLSLEEVLRGNLEKLQKRYPEGFDAEKSINR
jgi:RimJ/RimL family protein N-acetyltransferase/NTP pyrophosphatase (non-canonical NTP hydrolase)